MNFDIKKRLILFLNKLPYIRELHRKANLMYFPPGHYYSPIADIDQIKQREQEIWHPISMENIKGVDFNIEEQIILTRVFEGYYADIPFPENKTAGQRYYLDNAFYPYPDAIVLYFFIRHFKPRRIIEVGSGFSSAVMLDTKKKFDLNIDLTFIDIDTTRLFSLITEEEKASVRIITQPVQQVSLDLFEELEENDILFIDSSHIAKIGSDLNFLLFEVIPKLRKGVLIHFHDIFFPFEYPKEWVYMGWSWNENYILRAFLMCNNQFKIKYFFHLLHHLPEKLFDNMPLCNKKRGANLWIEKLN